MTMLIAIGISLGFVLVVGYFARHLLGGMVGLFRVVPVNEAHVRILGNKKSIYSARTGKSAYWVIPFMTRLHRLPLTNLAVPVNDVKLNDKNMAKFVCDLVCFINISNIELAVERLTLTDSEKEVGFDFEVLSEDLKAIMESIGRTVTTKQTIIDIYMDRAFLDKAITKDCEEVFPKWGISLVDLELKDIKDAAGSTIIADIERKVAAEIRRDADIKVAETARDAAVRVAQTTQESEVAKASSEETFRKRQVEKDKAVALSEQQKNLEIAQAETQVNFQKVEALRKLEVGKSEIQKQMAEQSAEAKRITLQVEAEGQAKQITSVGNAQASVVEITGKAEAVAIQTKKEAEAAGTLKLAEALQQFNDAALSARTLEFNRDILIAKWKSIGDALSKADVKWILSGENAATLFGLKLDAEGGANLEQFMSGSGLAEKIAGFLKHETSKEKGKT